MENKTSEARQLSEVLAQEHGMRQDMFLDVIKKTVMPSPNVSNEHIAAFLSLSRSYGLNPLSDAIHAFPSKGGIKLLIGIDGYIEIANQHKAYEGFELEEHHDQEDNLVAVSCKVHRSDRKHSHWIKEYMDECKRSTDPWKNFPKRMLRHKAIMQAIRSSFGLSSLIDADEAKDMGYNAQGIKIVSTPKTPLTERLESKPKEKILFEVETAEPAATESLTERLSEEDNFEAEVPPDTGEPTQQPTQWTLNKALGVLKQCKSAEGLQECMNRHQPEWERSLSEGELVKLRQAYKEVHEAHTGFATIDRIVQQVVDLGEKEQEGEEVVA